MKTRFDNWALRGRSRQRPGPRWVGPNSQMLLSAGTLERIQLCAYGVKCRYDGDEGNRTGDGSPVSRHDSNEVEFFAHFWNSNRPLSSRMEDGLKYEKLREIAKRLTRSRDRFESDVKIDETDLCKYSL